jgi:hypothetical protein
VSPEAFATCILRYLNEPDLLSRHRECAALAAAAFDPEAMGNAYGEVYRKALTRTATPRL